MPDFTIWNATSADEAPVVNLWRVYSLVTGTMIRLWIFALPSPKQVLIFWSASMSRAGLSAASWLAMMGIAAGFIMWRLVPDIANRA